MTSGVTPFPDLYSTDQGRMAFIVNGRGGKLIKTPTDNARKNISVYNLKSSFRGGTITTDMTIDAAGMQSDMLKTLFKGFNADLREQSIKEMVKTFTEKASLQDIISHWQISDLVIFLKQEEYMRNCKTKWCPFPLMLRKGP